MNSTDNEDEKTKGKEREIKRLNNWSARAAGFFSATRPGSSHWQPPEGSTRIGVNQVVSPAFRLHFPLKPVKWVLCAQTLPVGR